MKIGIQEIKKAYLGNLELNSRNAYVSTYPLIKSSPVVDYGGFCIEALEDIVVNFMWQGVISGYNGLEYSKDGINWQDTDIASSGLTASKGQKIYLRGDNTRISLNQNNYRYLRTNGKHNVSGNILSLVYKDFEDKTDTPTTDSTFTFLFYNDVDLVSAENLILPCENMRSYMYYGLFDGCTNLEKAPKELPSTKLGSYCYQMMFYNCKKLTEVPSLLPAQNVSVVQPYHYMFYGCESLRIPPVINLYGALGDNTTTGTIGSYMFYNCPLEEIRLPYLSDFSEGTKVYLQSWINSENGTAYLCKSLEGKLTPSNNTIPTSWTTEYTYPKLPEMYPNLVARQPSTYSSPEGTVSDKGTYYTFSGTRFYGGTVGVLFRLPREIESYTFKVVSAKKAGNLSGNYRVGQGRLYDAYADYDDAALKTQLEKAGTSGGTGLLQERVDLVNQRYNSSEYSVSNQSYTITRNDGMFDKNGNWWIYITISTSSSSAKDSDYLYMNVEIPKVSA